MPLFFFGAMSPYSWFAAERIETLIPEARWRPVFAGGLFRANGRSTWGIGERREAGLADCEQRAELHGLGPIVWPDPWPTNDVLVARAMAYAEERGRLRDYALTAMRLAFKEGGELGRPETIAEVARRIGMDADELVAAVQREEIKNSVRRRHEEAMGHGVFGVPTVVTATGLYWGDDRLEEAAVAARPGPAPSASAG